MTSTGNAVLDQSVLDGMVNQIGAGVARSMLEEFIKSGPAMGETLTKALRTADRDAASKSAHQLKSMAGYVGAKELSTTCMAIDERAFDGFNAANADDVQNLLDDALAAARQLLDVGWPDA